MQSLPVKDDFPPGFYEEFARLVVAFGRLEYLIKLCIKDLSNKGFTEGMVEAESIRQFRDLCEKAEALAKGKLNQSQVATLLNQAIELAEFRHDTVHASWTTNPQGAPLRIRPKCKTPGSGLVFILFQCGKLRPKQSYQTRSSSVLRIKSASSPRKSCVSSYEINSRRQAPTHGWPD